MPTTQVTGERSGSMYGVGFDAGEGAGDDCGPPSGECTDTGGLSFESNVALPPPDEVATWLAALIARDGARQ